MVFGEMKLTKRLLSFVLCFVMTATIVTGCSSTVTEGTTAGTTSAAETSESATESATEQTTSKEPWFTFKPKVCSSFHEGILGKEMCDSWYSLVDAVMAGEDTFSCPNGHVYFWMIAEFPKVCFPLMSEIIEIPDDFRFADVNGTAKIKYKVSKEEASQKIAEFQELTEGIINEVMKPEYSDFENALALYSYFTHTYTYDYETFYKIENDEIVNYTSSYRLLTTKTGICCEISEAYSYLLLQVGIDAATVMTSKHEWSIIRLGDNYYHIDPTFGVEDKDFLGFFLMNDKQREETLFYGKKDYSYVAFYDPESVPDYSANDDTFKVLWDYHLSSFDHETKKIECWKYAGDGQESFTFDYGFVSK